MDIVAKDLSLGGQRQASIDLVISEELDALFRPAPRSGVPSGWYGHVPFAYWIMTALRPRCFVELGTHNGVSYSAFCDAVLRGSLDTRCFAIDTWRGDQHAGLYGEEVYENFRAFHDKRFGGFSELIRTTFDQALAGFADASIDLLHIDGCHSYDTVRHDFENWRPKLSSRGVVLFHDTNVRDRDFGVWRLWDELQTYPHFEFLHGHGLGVLAYGAEAPEAVLKLCNTSDPNAIAAIRDRFAHSGRTCSFEADIAQLESDIEILRISAESKEKTRAKLFAILHVISDTRLNHMRNEADEAKTALATVNEQLSVVRRGLTAAQAAREATRADLTETAKTLTTVRAQLAAVQSELAASQAELADTRHALAHHSAHAAALVNSTSWKLTRPIRVAVTSSKLQVARFKLLCRALAPGGARQRKILEQSLRRRLGRSGAADAARLPDDRYEDWIARFDTLKAADVRDIMIYPPDKTLPRILVLICIASEPKQRALNTVASLRNQLRDNWHAVLCFGQHGRKGLRSELEAGLTHDSRFTFTDAAASERDLEASIPVQSSDLIVVVAAGIELREHALYMFAAHALEHPDVRLIYSDEDQIGPSGERHSPFFKPDMSPALLRCVDYFGRCYLLKPDALDLQDLIRHLSLPAGIRGYGRTVAQGLARNAVHHIPSILFHDPAADDLVTSPAKHEFLRSADVPGISIVIPTRNGLGLLSACLASIRRLTAYPAARLEILVVDNDSDDPQMLEYLASEAQAGRITTISYPGPFNYSAINNFAAAKSRGDLLVFLNNDTEVLRPDWLQVIASYAMQNDVAAVGAKLLYPDLTVQHGGVVIGIQGVAGHAHVGLGQSSPGYRGLANLTHEVAAVTGACLAMRRTVFQQIGGFDEELHVSFNDVLLCLRALSAGYRNVYVGDPLLIHCESKTRGFDDTPAKIRLFRREAEYTREQYSRLFKLDPFYNPQLSIEEPYKLAFPPRSTKPWRSFARRGGAPLRVLMLSVTHQIGHGVPVVISLQAEYLVEKGMSVFIGGPLGANEFSYQGCLRVELNDPHAAACFAFENNIDCVVVHTPPFFSTFRWFGEWPRSIAYDHGEPPPDLFPDALSRRAVLAEKRYCLAMADRTIAISQSVRAESNYAKASVIRHGNSHLAVWDDNVAARRAEIRRNLNLEPVIILNVCRFHAVERHYKGVNTYAEVKALFKSAYPTLADFVSFVLAGKANETDVVEMEAKGLRVFANPTDRALVDLYVGSDIYMNFSQWEGYNLGIAQALALGLPVIASNIPAHREFPISTPDTLEGAVAMLATWVDNLVNGRSPTPRQPLLSDWKSPLDQFFAVVNDVCES